jgi:hypothetical protein
MSKRVDALMTLGTALVAGGLVLAVAQLAAGLSVAATGVLAFGGAIWLGRSDREADPPEEPPRPRRRARMVGPAE